MRLHFSVLMSLLPDIFFNLCTALTGQMASLAKAPPTMWTIHRFQPRSVSLLKLSKKCLVPAFPRSRSLINRSPICCTKVTPWESTTISYAPPADAAPNFLKKTSEIFDTQNSEATDDAGTAVTDGEDSAGAVSQPLVQFQFHKWPMWVLGPCLLLSTGMAPTLWLPLSSVFLGPNVASLLSLIGLDCIFNLGATLFLLMADSCSRPKDPAKTCNSTPPFSYKFWNMVANVSGFVIPLMVLLGSQKGFIQPHLPFIPSAVLLGPYLLLLLVQILTELLTWHWQSPVWLVTPVVYEAYRVLQLMRGLKLGAELSAPAWMLHTIRGLVSWWILILGVQLMRVAWFAGFTANVRQQVSPASADG
ncbi:hypothetical protein Tsubulata_010055 [Turnera subulata]|uniref:Cytochrome P450 family protein n=1 Tax=Turnera subulata TaxID=218843 RepID=A0A9Q0FYA0_9ROSI|nr:hypothetical protein Tsubulata_010055 [Turnera subulata]